MDGERACLCNSITIPFTMSYNFTFALFQVHTAHLETLYSSWDFVLSLTKLRYTPSTCCRLRILCLDSHTFERMGNRAVQKRVAAESRRRYRLREISVRDGFPDLHTESQCTTCCVNIGLYLALALKWTLVVKEAAL